MKKVKPQSPPQGHPAHEQPDAKSYSHSQVVDTVAPLKTPELPTHPALSCWDINRKLDKLTESHGRDQNQKPAEIESSSSVGNPRSAAISWRVKRLQRYVEEIKAVYEMQIETGRFADTPDLWAAVYAQKILPSVAPIIGSLRWHMEHSLFLTGGGQPGERATVDEEQRELSRLRARIERDLANAVSQVDALKVEKFQKSLVKGATGEVQVQRAPGRVSSSLSRGPQLRSPVRRAAYAYLAEHRFASDKETWEWLSSTNPKVIPASWEHDASLPGKLFTKVRKILSTHHEMMSTTITRQ